MSEINLPPFYIGQKVVRLYSSSSLVKGNVYTVNSLRFCRCNQWRIAILEDKENYEDYSCERCKTSVKDNCAFLAKLFTAVKENFQPIELSEVLETETKLISVN